MNFTSGKLQYRLGVPLIVFIAIIISVAMVCLYVSISSRVSSLSHETLHHAQRITKSSVNQFNQYLGATVRQFNEMSEQNLAQLKAFQLKSADELFQLTQRPFEKAFNTGDKRAVRVWLKREGAVSGVKEVSFLNSKGVVRFSSDEKNLGRTLDPAQLQEFQQSTGKIQRWTPDGLEIFVPKKVERKCTLCHIHYGWENKVGQIAGFFYLRVSTEGYEALKQESSAFLQKMKESNRAALDKILSEGRTETNAITAGNQADVEAINHSNLKIFSISMVFILITCLLVIFYLVGTILVKPLKGMVRSLDDCASNVSSSSHKIAESSHHLADHTSNQAASIEETSSSLEELSSMTKQNADHAQEANALMHESIETVTRADDSMQHLNTAMNDIASASEETSKIIKTIEEIAFQTNLLALNAAVEAARAGEAGAGFAVVADEVRNLAMRSSEAAKDTSALIRKTAKKVKQGTELVTKTYGDFSKVHTSATKVAEIIGEIAAASGEQANGIEQINQVIGEMDRLIQENAASANDSATASRAMNARSIEMKTMVSNLVKLMGEKTMGGHAALPHGATDVKRLPER
jgi:hypothetical protein